MIRYKYLILAVVVIFIGKCYSASEACSVKVELLPNKKLTVHTGDELCECLGYKKYDEEVEKKTLPCDLKSVPIDGKISFNVASVCDCIGYETDALIKTYLTIDSDKKTNNTKDQVAERSGIRDVRNVDSKVIYNGTSDTDNEHNITDIKTTSESNPIVISNDTKKLEFHEKFVSSPTLDEIISIEKNNETKEKENSPTLLTESNTEPSNGIESPSNISASVNNSTNHEKIFENTENSTAITNIIINETTYRKIIKSIKKLDESNTTHIKNDTDKSTNLKSTLTTTPRHNDLYYITKNNYSLDKKLWTISTEYKTNLIDTSTEKTNKTITKTSADFTNSNTNNESVIDNNEYKSATKIYNEDVKYEPVTSSGLSYTDDNRATDNENKIDFNDYNDESNEDITKDNSSKQDETRSDLDSDGSGDDSDFPDDTDLYTSKGGLRRPPSKNISVVKTVTVSNDYESSSEKTSEDDNTFRNGIIIFLGLLIGALFIILIAIYVYTWFINRGSYDVQPVRGGNLEMASK